MKLTSLHSLFALFLASLLSLPACAPGPLSQSQGKSVVPAAAKPITPYTGPVDVGFDSSLISPTLAAYGFKKTLPRQTMAFADEGEDFSIQNVPEGQVVFSETFTKGRRELEEVREIRLADTSKRYTLHVQKQGDPHRDGRVVVNINGTNWIKEADFEGQTQEVTRKMLLLNANNSLRVRLNGREGTRVTVTLVEGGEAGTVLRRRGRLGQPGETHETHVRRNDTNIFDPNDPTSLGGLAPYSQIPKSEDGRSLPSISLNGGVPATVSAGEVQVKLKAPVQQNLNALLQKYNGVVTGTISEDEFLVFMDLSKVNLAQLPANLRALNTQVDASAAIEEVTFDSLEGAQMMALMTELLLDARQGNRVLALDINPVLESNAAAGSVEGSAGSKSMNAQESWWLTQTGALGAWDYSLGFNRQANKPVYVAVIDTDFEYLDIAKQNNEDLQSQVLTTRAALVYFKRFPEAGAQAGYRQLLTVLDPGVGAPPGVFSVDSSGNPIPFNFYEIGGKGAHGTSQSSTIASVVNNGKGIAGVAPHAKILPIKIGTFRGKTPAGEGAHAEIAMGWDLRVAIEAAGRLKADIVSITSSTVIDGISNWVTEVNKLTTGSQYGWLNALQVQVDNFAGPTDPNGSGNWGICVFNAGNAGNHVRHTLPAGKLKGIVIAGAIKEDRQRALFGSDRAHVIQRLFTGGSCPPSGSQDCNLDSNDEGASAWWLGAGNPAPSSSLNPNLKAEIEAWENGLGAQNLKLWTPGNNMGAVGKTNPSYGLRSDWGGTSAAAPFAAGSLALLKALKPTLRVQELISSSLLRYQPTTPYSDDLLKDYYADRTNRKGVRLAPFMLSTPLLNLEKTIVENPVFNSSSNKIETVVATLRKQGGGRPFLEGQAGKTFDLSMFIDVPVFQGTSTFDAVYKAAFARESEQLNRDGWQTFWSQQGPNTAGNPVLLTDFQDKKVSVRGWHYTPNNESEENIEPFAVSEHLGGGSTGSRILSAEAPPLESITLPSTPKWLVRDSRHLAVYPDQYLGIAIEGQQLDGIQVLIDGQYQPIKQIASKYVLLDQMPNLTPGIKDVILQFAGGNNVTIEEALEIIALPRLQEIQSISTTGAARFAAFQMGSDAYLAVANAYNEPPPRYDQRVDVYKWMNSQFSFLQAIPTNGAHSVEAFTIGTDQFLAVAEYYHSADRTFDFNSRIFKWNGSQFVEFQSIPTHGAAGWKHFMMGTDHYLAVANFATGTGGFIVSVNQDSVIYKWNGSQFVAFQSIPTTAARDWEHVQIGNDHFLAVANDYDGSSYNTSTNIYSEIFKWNGSQFTLFQRVHSEGARDWEAFKIGDKQYLALANLWGATRSPTTAEKPKVYEWNGSQFVVAQEFDAYVISWDHARVKERDYLLSAGWDTDGTRMYRWNGSQFDLHQAIATPGAYDALFFSIGGNQYYVSESVFFANGSYHTTSKIYKFE